jgi:hypothetical protein
MEKTIVQTFLLVLFKSGTYRGSAQLIITPITPSGESLQSMFFPLRFEGDDERGAGIAIPLGYPVSEEGLYWFEVSLSLQNLPASVFTYIPMRIAYHYAQPSQGKV